MIPNSSTRADSTPGFSDNRESAGSATGPGAAPASTLPAHLAMLLFVALVAGSFSIGGLVADKIDPAALTAIRFLLGSAMMAAVAAILLRGRMNWRPAAPWRFLVLGGLMGAYFVTMFMALGLTDPVSTGAVFTLMPLMSAGFGYLILRQVPGAAVLVSLVFAGLGAVWVIFRGDLDALMRFDVGRGEAIFFVGCVCHGAYAPLVRKLSRGEPVVAFTLFSLVGTGLLVAIYGVRGIAATDWTALPGIVWLAVAYLAIFTTGSTTFLLQYASMRLPASKVLAYSYLTPSAIILYEGVAGRGWPSASVLVGAGVSVLGLIVLARTKDE